MLETIVPQDQFIFLKWCAAQVKMAAMRGRMRKEITMLETDPPFGTHRYTRCIGRASVRWL